MAYPKSASKDVPTELYILNGELRGVSVPLAGDEIRLGSSPECDVVLLDEFGEPSEVVISPDEDGAYTFEAVTGSVRIGRRYLKNGSTKKVANGLPVVVGDVEMILASTLDNADKSKRSYRRRSFGALLIAPIVVAAGVLGFWSLSGGTGSVVAKSAPVPKLTYVLDRSGSSESMVAAKALQKRLDEMGFHALNIVGDQAEYLVKVEGKLKISERNRWLQTVEWFDQSFGKSVYLEAKITHVADEITLPFSIEAIWVGKAPRVTLHDGSKRTIGEELPGGWVLDAVAQESVTITKDDETLDVAL